MESPVSAAAVPSRPYPVFLSLEGRACLVVGGGTVGERKARRLVDYGARVALVSEKLTPWLEDQVRQGRMVLLGDRYRSDLVEGMTLVFAATSDQELNRRIAEDTRKTGGWCNMATDPEMGDFLLPSIFEQGSLCIAFSTGGMAPGVARLIREQFERDFGPEWVSALDFLGRLRKAVKSLEVSGLETERIFTGLARLSVHERIVEGDFEGMLQAVAAVCSPCLDAEKIRELWKDAWKQLS
ncbi:MAG: bifunctional precorrin-2 dehydrogenase/sirohydrochlorin ferrochelatase [Syntrophobacteraceae bacterium]|jgi:precorrin-2 dehydrogenase/sirohydrochlorin ferrochelatase|nr:bifunctional precorrin-2 dehydrogenase/sirohydrochlorin ferrochelatase [Syntrophobacteraceae bacterium]